MNDVTQLLEAAAAGDANARARVVEAVYSELRRLAAGHLANEAPGHTLDATALVHEAYLRLGGSEAAPFQNRKHFFASAAEAMRRILIDHARGKHSAKRGGGRRISLSDAGYLLASTDALLDLNEALIRLAAEEPRKAELVELRFFAGLTIPEAAAQLGISIATAERWWAFARTWLYAELADGDSENLRNR